MVSDFKKLQVWQKATDLAVLIYKKTDKFPKSEIYGLSSQIRRAAVSVSSNIAEGCGKSTKADMIRYLYNSYGSIKEVECQLIIADRLGYLLTNDFEDLVAVCREVSKMLYAFTKHLEKHSANS